MTRVDDTQRAPLGEAAAAWWLKLRSEQGLSPDDETLFEAWISEDAHVAALRECAATWRALDGFSDAPEVVARRAQALEQMRLANRQRWGKPSHLPRYSLALIALLMVIATTTLGAWHFWGSSSQELATETGERRAVLLADGSRVSLDARTKVSVSLQDKHRRVLIGEGRAKFDVAYEPYRPFTVEAGGHIVVATGTSFSTELVNNVLHVIVYEGKVVVLDGPMPAPETLLSLRKNPNGRAMAIVPGQELILGAGLSPVVRRDTPGSAAWEAGQLEFFDEPLSDAVAQLARYSTDEIAISDPRVAALKINGVFKAGDTAAFLQAVTDMFPVVVHRPRPKRIEIAHL